MSTSQLTKLFIITVLLLFVNISDASTSSDFDALKQQIGAIKTEYPQLSKVDLQNVIKVASTRYGVDKDLLAAILKIESRFSACAVSYRNGKPVAKGIAQFIPSTAKAFHLHDPFEPVSAINASAAYLAYIQTEVGSIPLLVAASYNAGVDVVHKDFEQWPNETKRYVEKLTKELAAIERVGWYEYVPDSISTGNRAICS